jgi:hypothetical protein
LSPLIEILDVSELNRQFLDDVHAAGLHVKGGAKGRGLERHAKMVRPSRTR